MNRENEKMTDLKNKNDCPSVEEYMDIKKEIKKLEKDVCVYKRKISVAMVVILKIFCFEQFL